LNKKGFTLVELLVAATIFLVATFAFAYLLKIGMASVQNTARLNLAIYSLQAQAEEMRSLPFSSLVSLNGRSFAQGKGKISVIPAVTDLLKIELELEWDPNKIPLKITTLRSNY
jgi:prepilin-type N-terminal cleavage/methylation domain-containing protein